MDTHQAQRESSPSRVCIPALVDMQALPTHPLRSHQRQDGGARGVLQAITRWRERLLVALGRARQRAMLAQLGPLMLRDLGLSDADVWRETRKSPWRA